MPREPFQIDLSERFPHLPSAPVVEAVIHWQARAGRTLSLANLQENLTERLPDYPNREPQHLLRFAAHGSIASQNSDWYGMRVSDPEKRYIAQFTRDGLVFSRLAPYNDWTTFSREARRCWSIFVELAAPSEIQRLGVRFINKISSANLDNLGDYLREPPSRPSNLPLNGFWYQSSFKVPNRSFEIRVGKMFQPESPLPQEGLILDIDVVARSPIQCDDAALDRVLPEMRWLKNRIFFDLLTPEAIESFTRN